MVRLFRLLMLMILLASLPLMLVAATLILALLEAPITMLIVACLLFLTDADTEDMMILLREPADSCHCLITLDFSGAVTLVDVSAGASYAATPPRYVIYAA